jgi:hypothetical protein
LKLRLIESIKEESGLSWEGSFFRDLGSINGEISSGQLDCDVLDTWHVFKDEVSVAVNHFHLVEWHLELKGGILAHNFSLLGCEGSELQGIALHLLVSDGFFNCLDVVTLDLILFIEGEARNNLKGLLLPLWVSGRNKDSAILEGTLFLLGLHDCTCFWLCLSFLSTSLCLLHG